MRAFQFAVYARADNREQSHQVVEQYEDKVEPEYRGKAGCAFASSERTGQQVDDVFGHYLDDLAEAFAGANLYAVGGFYHHNRYEDRGQYAVKYRVCDS